MSSSTRPTCRGIRLPASALCLGADRKRRSSEGVTTRFLRFDPGSGKDAVSRTISGRDLYRLRDLRVWRADVQGRLRSSAPPRNAAWPFHSAVVSQLRGSLSGIPMKDTAWTSGEPRPSQSLQPTASRCNGFMRSARTVRLAGATAGVR